jgi:hypothetical protein
MAKKPVIERWQELRLDTPEKVSECFNGVRQNRGVLLGDISRGLADVDCDVICGLFPATHSGIWPQAKPSKPSPAKHGLVLQ